MLIHYFESEIKFMLKLKIGKSLTVCQTLTYLESEHASMPHMMLNSVGFSQRITEKLPEFETDLRLK